MNKQQRFFPPMVGGSSLLVIFAVLCLTVFALLSLSTVMADGRLSGASVEAVAEYYEADSQAEEIWARLRNGQIPEQVRQEGDIYAYTCPISETQTLWVELRRREDTWTVLRWQAVARAELPEEELTVWSGESNGGGN